MRFSEMNVNEGTPNKVAALLILEILREYTDENHTVTRQWLAEKLAKKDFTIDPKTIVRHLVALKNLGYPRFFNAIRCRTIVLGSITKSFFASFSAIHCLVTV